MQTLQTIEEEYLVEKGSQTTPNKTLEKIPKAFQGTSSAQRARKPRCFALVSGAVEQSRTDVSFLLLCSPILIRPEFQPPIETAFLF